MARQSDHIPDVAQLTTDLGRRTARGGVTAITAQFTRILAQLAIAAVMARLLAPGDFGLVAMAMTLTSFVGIFTDLGLSAATVQRKEIDHTTVSALFWVNVATGCLLAAVCTAAAPLAAWLFGDQRVVWVTVALGLSIPVSAAGAQHAALLQRGMRWMEMQWTPIIAQSAGGLIAIALAWATHAGYWALVGQAWASTLISTALLWTFCRWRPGSRPHWRGAGSALGLGLQLTGFNFVNYFHRQFDNVLIGWRWGAVDLGYYTRAYTLLTLPLTLVSGPIASAVVPALSRLQDDPERWRSAFLRIFIGVNLLSAALSAVLIASAEPLVRVVYGAQWIDAGPVFLLLSISMFAATAFNAAGWVYISLGQTQRLLRWGIYVTFFFVASFFVGLPYGPKGVALCYSLAMCLVAVPSLAFVTRRAPVGFFECFWAWLPPTIAGGTAAWGARYLAGLWVQGNPMLAVVELSSIALGLYSAAVCILIALRIMPFPYAFNRAALRKLLVLARWAK